MTLRKSLLCLVLLAGARAAWALDKNALLDHLRESYRIPPGLEVTIGEPKPSEVQGFDAADVTLSRGGMSQVEKVYISKDGRHYILGGFKDLKLHPDQDRLQRMDLKDAASRGPEKAPVQIVQYTDFQCPYCQKGYEIMRDKVMKEYPKQVRWYYKSMPLTNIHPWAEPAAVAVECAKQQGLPKFWVMHDQLFDKQREINLSNLDQKLQDVAGMAKLDTKPFMACYDEKKTLAAVQRDAKEAESIGITGTPAFVINGHLIGGADYDAIKQVIEEALKGKHGKL
jgi:protein-disulfide isomerase